MFGQDELNEAMIKMKNYVDAKHDLLCATVHDEKEEVKLAESNVADAEGELERYDG